MISAPAVGVSISVSSRASVDLPEPDSPTTASVRPAFSVNETPASALTLAAPREQAARDRDIRATSARASSTGAHAARLAALRARRGSSGVKQRARPEFAARRGRRGAPAGVEGEAAARREQAARAAGRTGPARRREWRAAGAASRARAARRAARRCRDDADRRTVRASSFASTCCPAYCTMTRSAVSATTPMSWVISTSPMPFCWRSETSRSRICAWIVTSSAVVGSSAISSFGRQASAIAIITRWLMPPES